MPYDFTRRLKRQLALRNLFGIEPAIVFQMAKVGSRSVVEALERCGQPVFHVHRMDADHLQRMREQRRALGWFIPPAQPHDLLGLYIRRRLIDRGGRAKIVTLVRDPLARNLSSYFEHLDAIWSVPHAHEVIPPERLASGFIERYTHDEPLTWFDDEMLPVTGIDVYEHPFPARGFVTIQTRRLQLLVMKSELPDQEKSAALAAFFGINDLVLRPVNRTVDKAKGEAYSAFVDGLRLDPSFVDRMLESRYARHFYSHAEREAMRQRYSIEMAPNH